MQKSTTLTNREIGVFLAVVIVIFVLFFAPNYAVIMNIQKDVKQLTVQDEGAHLPEEYCATSVAIQSCADRCQGAFGNVSDPVVFSCYRMCTNVCTCDKGIAALYFKNIQSYCGAMNSTSCYEGCSWQSIAITTQVPYPILIRGLD